MIFGMSIHAFTVTHVIISLVGIVSGLYVVVGGLMRGRLSLPNSWCSAYLCS